MLDKAPYRFKFLNRRQRQAAIVLALLFLLEGCAGDRSVSRDTSYQLPPRRLPAVRYTIQVGAFADVNNAVRLTERLQSQQLNAYHFLHDVGLYKVRFGNFSSKSEARTRAEELKDQGIIDVFYIVGPEDYAAGRNRLYSDEALREDIVNTARRYLGVPYQWGGESIQTGFDCSGLTMVVYQLNGLDLPRSSVEQWKVGQPVNRNDLEKGDLVFFATSGSGKVSHVGIYAGNNKFLHAPGRGRRIRTSSLSSQYFKSRYLGARTYL